MNLCLFCLSLVDGMFVFSFSLPQLLLPSPALQTGPPDVVEVDDKQIRFGSLQRVYPLLGLSDHDHLRGEVRVRFSAPPSDVVDQNPHDGCHRLPPP